MNDDFLHRLRVEPSPEFLANLKSRLDRQPSPQSGSSSTLQTAGEYAAPAPSTARLQTRYASILRALLIALLFGGSVFAITLLSINGGPAALRNLFPTSQSDRPPQNTDLSKSAGAGSANAPLDDSNQGNPSRSASAAARSALGGASASGSGGARTTGSPTSGQNKASAKGTQPTTIVAATHAPTDAAATIGSPATRGVIVNFVTPAALENYITPFADNARTRIDIKTTVTVVATSTDAFAELCTPPPDPTAYPALDVATTTRQITPEERAACERNLSPYTEIRMGHQAIVVVRSSLYGAVQLTPQELFLALAAEVPDPAHPDELIPNPNKLWSQINGRLEEEPIEVIGPPLSSTTGRGFLDMMIEAACNNFPAIASLRHTDPARYEHLCKTVRTDGTYVVMEELPFTVVQRLQSNPNAIGIVGYNLFTSTGSTLLANPVDGVVPTLDTIRSGAYPLSRALYVYVNMARRGWTYPYSLTSYAQTLSRFPNTYSMIPLDSPRRSPQ